jgi:regulator of replication initiation timing
MAKCGVTDIADIERPVIETLSKRIRELESELAGVRHFLWCLHPAIGKYADDGEMQCRGLDYRRQPLVELMSAIRLAIQVEIARLRDELAAANKEVKRDTLEMARMARQLEDCRAELAGMRTEKNQAWETAHCEATEMEAFKGELEKALDENARLRAELERLHSEHDALWEWKRKQPPEES